MIFITGASGNIGSEVVRCLEQRQAPFRIGARKPTATGPTPTVYFDFLDASSYAPAVAGCTTVFLLRPPAIANTKRTLNVFIDQARASGVTQIVFISVAHAADNPLVPHHAVEQHLRAGPSGWTILRPGFFTQNLGDQYRRDIRTDQRIFLPAGAGRVAFIDVRDIAEIAALALIDPPAHRDQVYTLTGPAAYSFSDVAQLLTNELTRPIRYQPASIVAYLAYLARRGLPLMQNIVQTVLHVGLRYGQAQAVTATTANLLGRQPHSLADYLHTYRSLWLSTDASERSIGQG